MGKTRTNIGTKLVEVIVGKPVYDTASKHAQILLIAKIHLVA